MSNKRKKLNVFNLVDIKLLKIEEQCFGVLVLNVELTKQDLFQIQVEKDYYLEKK